MQLPFVVLKGFLYVRASLYSLHVPSGYGRRARSDVSKSHIFPQGVLAAISLVEGGAGDGRARARARASSMLSGHHCLTGGRVGAQGTGAEALKVRSELVPFPLSVCTTPLAMAPLPQWRAALEQQVLEGACGTGQGKCWDSPSKLVRAPGNFQSAASSCACW